MVLVHGGTADRGRWAPVLAGLAERYGVHAVDRRGRGLSTAEVGPYNIRREGEDIAAVTEAVGRDVYVVAHSYGALCALESALLTDAIGRMVLYEPPLPTGDRHVVAPDVLDRLRTATAAGHPEEVLKTFFREVIRLGPDEIEAMRTTPIWGARLAAAPTIVRELEAVGCFEVSDRLARIEIPVRLLLGTRSPAYFAPAAEAIAARLPQADVLPLHGQDHMGIDRDPEQFITAVLNFASSAGRQG
ncbi:alpha/beta fold hydrolase [Actinomadura rubrisoli]|uniref:Alpha/beta hydrolase n=1 Tax=Actinomadura rubrisoli TaxID=2530368 RepID=A0A4R5BMI0_9ACTN|nr:alpha/beta hydrolase [Actinomadura rubrisoli]TDD87115.1 alpha/beta hydrolase [Actinomadura rubrisoli]